MIIYTDEFINKQKIQILITKQLKINKMNIKKQILFLSVIGAIFSSCGKDENEVKPSVIFPLNVSNVWTFVDTTFHYSSHDIEIDTSKIMFDYFYEIDNFSGYSPIPIVKGNPISLLNTDSDGNLEEYLFKSDSLIFKTIHFKKNANKGDKWTFKTADYMNGDYTKVTILELEMECISSDTTISTPKGAFLCKGYKYSVNDGKDTFISYLSENIGLIVTLHYEGNNLFQKSTLLDYYVK